MSRARACFQDCIAGEHANFVRNDELRESWKLFDGLLTQVCTRYTHSSAVLNAVMTDKERGCSQIATEKPTPYIYKRGERGPVAADERLASLGFMRTQDYVGPSEQSK